MAVWAAAAWTCAAAVPSVRPFSDYEVILRRAPFGELAPAGGAAEEAEHVVPIQESFAAQMVLVGIWEVKGEDGMLEVAVTDKKDNQYFTLRIGETNESGVTLESADYEMDEAILKKGSEVVVLSMRAGTSGQVLSASELEARKGQMEQKRLSYAERRRLRAEARARPRELPKPKYTGEELERRLQESQMESIRKGMPPLPVQLTPENDAQLVAEGFLPPVDEEGYELFEEDGGYMVEDEYFGDEDYDEGY
jgi:hypothetical protein